MDFLRAEQGGTMPVCNLSTPVEAGGLRILGFTVLGASLGSMRLIKKQERLAEQESLTLERRVRPFGD